MAPNSRLNLLRSRIGLIVLVGVLAVTASGAGLYLYLSRPAPQVALSTPTPSVVQSAAPSAGQVGSSTDTDTSSAEALRVVSTSPTSGGTGAAPRSPIELSFNLPVNAAAAANYFSVLPATDGTFSQGLTDADIVFTPSGSFGRGSSVNVVLRKGYASRDGYLLEDDYAFTFTTGLAAAQVLFLVDSQVARLHSVQSGQEVSTSLEFGEGVPANTRLQTFRATSRDVLTAFVHRANGTYLDRPIATSRMELVSSERAVNGKSYSISQPDGIYLVLASNADGQYGALWLDFSRYGVILRQDDRKVVLAGSDLTTGATTPSFDVTFYNLRKSLHPVLFGSFSGTGEFPARYPAPLDLAVASAGGEEVVIPIGIAQTNADIKVIADLSAQPQIFLTTDRAGYQVGETVRFGGFVRMSNDQAYEVPAGMTLAVWSGYGRDKPVSRVVSVAADGTFHGTFAMPDAAFNTDGSDGLMTLFAGTPEQEAADSSLSSVQIAALGAHHPAASITVVFDKPAYVASDRIVATISAVDASGKPLSGRHVRLTIYSAARVSQPSEIDSYASPSTWGLPVRTGISVTLDADGRATYSFRANLAKKSADQEVTLAARLGSGASTARDAATAIVHQATRQVFLLPSRMAYQQGQLIIAPFVVEATSGERAPAVPMAWELTQTDYSGSKATTTIVASGTVTTDARGLGVVRTRYSGPAGDLELRVKGKDAAGNGFVDSRSLYVTQASAVVGGFGTDGLLQLSVLTDKIAYTPGETAHLTVISPAAMNVFMSMERGRIHGSKWITLEKGRNAVQFAISPDLAPGFTLMFSYFRDGSYVSEGMPIHVNNSHRILSVTLTPDKETYGAGDTAHLTIAVADASGAPVDATLLIDGFDAAMSAGKLVDQASLAGAFFTPALRGTNGSSSLVGIGNWGGRCGISGGGNEPAATNPGALALWRPRVLTDDAGAASIDVPIEDGPIRLTVFAATGATWLGQAQIELNVE